MAQKETEVNEGNICTKLLYVGKINRELRNLMGEKDLVPSKGIR